MEIKKKLIAYNHGPKMKSIDYIVIHETGNTDSGADAERHYKYFNGGDRGASAHYFVDDTKVLQLVEDTEQSWHNGKLYTSSPKVPQCKISNSIGIEICVNKDGNYQKAVKNAIELTKLLMAKHNIPVEKVVRHYDCTGKQCPSIMMKKLGAWEDFKKQLVDEDKYQKAVMVLVDKGIIGNPSAWYPIPKLNNVEALILKLGKHMFETLTYTSAIEQMCVIGLINSPQIWLEKSYTENNVKDLIIKVTKYI